MTDLGLVERALERSPKVILVESITNPLLRLTDVEGLPGWRVRGACRW